MHIQIDATSKVPPFEQVRVQVLQSRASGELPVGSRLPTVRALAAELGLAPNTVARAYRELEMAGVIETRGRRGSFVAPGATAELQASAAATSYAQTVRALGLPLPEAMRLVERALAHV